MAVYAPGDSPPAGGDQSGFLPWLQGLAPEAQSAIMRVMQNANPISPAAADTLNQAPNPLNNPTPVPMALQGGGPPVPPAMLSAAAQPPASMPPGAPTPPLPGGPQTGIGSSILPQARGVMPVVGPPQSPTPWFPSGGNTPLPWNGANAPTPPARPVTPTPSTAYPAATIPPNAVGLAPAAVAPSSPFGTIDAPNANPGTGGGMMGGALARGGPGSRGLITALDLSHLFGGGQAATPAALPKTKIKIPASARAEVPPDTTSNAPSDYGPAQKKAGLSKRKYGPDVTDPAGYHSGYY